MSNSLESEPRILIINDDQSLLTSRRMLLEDCGARVFTARGTAEAVRETLLDPVELVVIDVTNVGLEHGEMLCGVVKGIHPSQCVAFLATQEMGLLTTCRADRVIYRAGPRQMLVQLNEMLNGRLHLNLWESRGQRDEQGGEDSSSRE